ncbi:serine/threonine-protein kinase [Streptomyces sp. Li-HN-5-11]|uniref:serine/threonine-protein kinase n=1 Tax=Streptomyces sp. Li-HN-5-11 TaxID=3075432 RepID=UPI0028A63E81|nr:serine/threonine-protein kinase [Streptomyces sp. Li-HN-5-11]WNM36408.1 serine/threonine-protein kinase [Streptomyces sp. Li-HN-5-11]
MQGLLLAGRYRLADTIGSGGMGRVWRAHDEVLHRAVAIKELTAALYVSESDQAVLLARTRAEARAAARINHSAVVTVHDVLEHDGRPWIVMELVEGHSLADAVKEQGRVEPREAARIGLWVLRALRAAHAAGVLHRDVKPGNVLLGHDGRVLLTDFGIAQIEGDTTITRTGEVVGSVDYLAPERVRGHDPGASSDLWALGATLYTAVEGLSPFRRTSPLTTMQAVVDEEPRDPQYAGPLAPVITALLRKNPAERPDAAEAEQMLAEAAEGRRPRTAQAYVPTQSVGHGREVPTALQPGPQTAVTAPHGPVTSPTALGPAHATATAPAPPKRRRLRNVALVVVLAALIGGGTAAALQKWDPSGQQDATSASTSTSPSPNASAQSADTTDDLPAGWVRRQDPYGFSIAVPGPKWKRQVSDAALHQVDYTPDGGRHFIRVAIDDSPDFPNAHDHQLDLQQQLQRLVDYKRVTLQANTYRDRSGSLWEYTWTALAKDTPFPGPRHAIEETYFSREGVEYAIYMSSPAKDWAKTEKQFRSVLQSWQPDKP